MRSVHVYVRGATEADVAAYLRQTYPAQAHPWVEFKNGDPVLYISTSVADASEFEPDEWEQLCGSALGGAPTACVVAEVSGRYSGDEEIREFVLRLLRRFHGVAQDDYTSHPWTAAEVAADHEEQGHRFFDFQGWWDERAK